MIAAVTIPLVISHKKKAKLAADLEATAVRKPKIDTTDDTSIDVYAVDSEEEAGGNNAGESASEEGKKDE